MPSEPAGSTILKPIPASIRRELQEKFEGAKRQFAEQALPSGVSPAYGLLAECVLRDPGNTIYVVAFLQYLRAERSRLSKRWLGWLRGGGLQIAVPQNPLSDGNEVWKHLLSLPETSTPERSLLEIARVCLRYGCEQSALRLLAEATNYSPDDVTVRWELGLALLAEGEFDAAGQQFAAIQRIQPADEKAKQLLAALQLEPAGGNSPAADAVAKANLESQLAEAEQQIQQGRLSVAESLLAQLKLSHGGNLQVEFLQEEWLMARYQRELARGKAILALLENPAAPFQDLIARLEQELNRQEMAVFHARSKRLPEKPQWKLALAGRLKKAGNFSEAIATVAELIEPDLGPSQGGQDSPQELLGTRLAALVVSGECWQHLRQFDRAWGFLEKAAELAINQLAYSDAASAAELALYRAGVLGVSLGVKEKPERYLRTLLAGRGDYRDAAAWLDKAAKV